MSERRSDTEETLARVTELARRAIEAQTSVARQSIDLSRAALSSKLDPATAGRAWMEAVGRESAQYWKEVGALGLDVAGQLLTLGTRGVARVMSETQAAVRRGATAGSAHSSGEGAAGPAPSTGDGAGSGGAGGGDTRRRVAVTLRGSLGGSAQATVTVANQHPRPRRVLLRPSSLRDESGALVRLPFRVDPEGVTIPAGSEHAVHLEVDLPADAVLVGGRYHGTVDVSGGDEAVLDVTVEVVD